MTTKTDRDALIALMWEGLGSPGIGSLAADAWEVRIGQAVDRAMRSHAKTAVDQERLRAAQLGGRYYDQLDIDIAESMRSSREYVETHDAIVANEARVDALREALDEILTHTHQDIDTPRQQVENWTVSRIYDAIEALIKEATK